MVERSRPDFGRRFFGKLCSAAKLAQATAPQNSNRYRLDNARLCVISRRKAEFTGPALLSIANSGQMVLKLHDKIESRSLILVNCSPLKPADAVNYNKPPLGET
jgi:hypothetical protein